MLHLTSMRKLVLAACVVFVAACFMNRSWLAGEVRDAAGIVSLPVKLLWLSAQEPDGELPTPVRGVAARQVKDSWHAPRAGGRLHEGQDIFAPRGTEVYSASEGYVIKIGESPLGGKTVYVHGAGGRWYYYAHLDSYAPDLKVGDRVTHATLLGSVGTTGNAAGTPPHLHFGVYTTAGAINPLPLLVDRK